MNYNIRVYYFYLHNNVEMMNGKEFSINTELFV